jgi:hypothetical protein
MGRARRTHLQSDGGEIPVLTGNNREFFWKSPRSVKKYRS